MLKRIDYLDGFRGVAIILVILFHAFGRWPNLVPYGEYYAQLLIVKYGWVGVELFFIISGFVIFMTLDKSENYLGFIYKRWLRLFPAMLIVSTFIFLTAPFFYERPAGQPTLLSLLPGLIFTNPSPISKILGVNIIVLEGAFWSLYIEFFFYLLSGALFFLIGKYNCWKVLTLIFLMACAAATLSQNYYPFIFKVVMYFPFVYFGWFAAGAALYFYHISNENKWFCIGAILLFCSSYFTSMLVIQGFVAMICVSILFLISLKSQLLQSMLQWKPLLFFGFVSYPLYLLHENMMISIIAKLTHQFGPHLGLLYFIAAIVFILSISYAVVKWIEPLVKNLIESIVKKLGMRNFRA